MVDLESEWTARFRHGVSLQISGNRPSDLSWLAEFLCPWCDLDSNGQATVHVRLIRSDPVYRLRQQQWQERPAAARSSAALPCIRLDTQTVSFEAWQDEAGLRLYDQESACHIHVVGPRVEVVAAGENLRARLTLLRLVREIVTGAMAASEPVIDLHAAAYAIGGQAVLIAGPKMAGKTSLLCHALLAAGASLLANDRVLVRADRSPPTVIGIPTLVTIRPHTVALFPQLQNQADAFPGMPSGGSSLTLSPAGLAGRLGVGQCARAELAAIILSAVNEQAAGWTLSRLPPGEAAAQLEACRYGAASGGSQVTVFAALAAGHDSPPAASGGAMVSSVTTATAVYRCELGSGAYTEPGLGAGAGASLAASLQALCWGPG